MSNFSDLVDAYESSTTFFLEQLSQLTEKNIDQRVPGGWTARQVIHHVADSETQSYARLRRLLAEPTGSLTQGYDEAAWAETPELGYQTLPIEASVEVFRAVRTSSLAVLRGLNASYLEREGVHTEGGKYTLAMWLDIYTRHPREHAAQLREAITEGEPS
jgi:DinB superfamily